MKLFVLLAATALLAAAQTYTIGSVGTVTVDGPNDMLHFQLSCPTQSAVAGQLTFPQMPDDNQITVTLDAGTDDESSTTVGASGMHSSYTVPNIYCGAGTTNADVHVHSCTGGLSVQAAPGGAVTMTVNGVAHSIADSELCCGESCASSAGTIGKRETDPATTTDVCNQSTESVCQPMGGKLYAKLSGQPLGTTGTISAGSHVIPDGWSIAALDSRTEKLVSLCQGFEQGCIVVGSPDGAAATAFQNGVSGSSCCTAYPGMDGRSIVVSGDDCDVLIETPNTNGYVKFLDEQFDSCPVSKRDVEKRDDVEAASAAKRAVESAESLKPAVPCTGSTGAQIQADGWCNEAAWDNALKLKLEAANDAGSQVVYAELLVLDEADGSDYAHVCAKLPRSAVDNSYTNSGAGDRTDIGWKCNKAHTFKMLFHSDNIKLDICDKGVSEHLVQRPFSTLSSSQKSTVTGADSTLKNSHWKNAEDLPQGIVCYGNSFFRNLEAYDAFDTNTHWLSKSPERAGSDVCHTECPDFSSYDALYDCPTNGASCDAPSWEFALTHELTIKKSELGITSMIDSVTGGLSSSCGKITISSFHASPAKACYPENVVDSCECTGTSCSCSGPPTPGTPADEPDLCLPECVVIIDEDTIDNGVSTIETAAYAKTDNGEQLIPSVLVNDEGDWEAYRRGKHENIPGEGPNAPLYWNVFHPGESVWLPSGQKEDEGLFRLPETIAYADSSNDPQLNDDALWKRRFVRGTLAQEHLDKVRNVRPLRNNEIEALVGQSCVAVVYDSDISIDYTGSSGNMNTAKNLYTGNLQGERYGLFYFTVEEVRNPGNLPESGSSSSLKEIKVRVDAPWDGTFTCPEPTPEPTPDTPEPTPEPTPLPNEHFGACPGWYLADGPALQLTDQCPGQSPFFGAEFIGPQYTTVFADDRWVLELDNTADHRPIGAIFEYDASSAPLRQGFRVCGTAKVTDPIAPASCSVEANGPDCWTCSKHPSDVALYVDTWGMTDGANPYDTTDRANIRTQWAAVSHTATGDQDVCIEVLAENDSPIHNVRIHLHIRGGYKGIVQWSNVHIESLVDTNQIPDVSLAVPHGWETFGGAGLAVHGGGRPDGFKLCALPTAYDSPADAASGVLRTVRVQPGEQSVFISATIDYAENAATTAATAASNGETTYGDRGVYLAADVHFCDKDRTAGCGACANTDSVYVRGLARANGMLNDVQQEVLSGHFQLPAAANMNCVVDNVVVYVRNALPNTCVFVESMFVSSEEQCLITDDITYDDLISWGDPHMRTLDGAVYDLQTKGELTLVHDIDAGMEVQVRHTNASAFASITTAVVVGAGANRVQIERAPAGRGHDEMPTVIVNGERVDVSPRSPRAYPLRSASGSQVVGSLKAHGELGVATNPLTYSLSFSSGRARGNKVTVVVLVSAAGHQFLDVQASIVSGSRTEGLLGNNDGVPSNDVCTRDGTQCFAGDALTYDALYRTVVPTWRVTDETSLFTYPAGASTASYTDTAFPADIANWLDAFSSEQIETARDACSPALVVGQAAFDACLFDVLQMNDLTLAQYAVAGASTLGWQSSALEAQTETEESSSSTNTGAIVAVSVIAGIALLVVAAFVAFHLRRRYLKQQAPTETVDLEATATAEI